MTTQNTTTYVDRTAGHTAVGCCDECKAKGYLWPLRPAKRRAAVALLCGGCAEARQ